VLDEFSALPPSLFGSCQKVCCNGKNFYMDMRMCLWSPCIPDFFRAVCVCQIVSSFDSL